MKLFIFLIVTLSFTIISCGDETAETGDVKCSNGAFYHDSGNCVNPCDDIDCGEGECTGVSAVKYECSKPNCIMPKVYSEATNSCVEPCDTIDCGDGECVVVTDTEVKCSPPVCDSGLFANLDNRCVNPCENIDCGNGQICQGIDSETFSCEANCSSENGYFEEDNQCVSPCYAVNCGLGETTCISDSITEFHCECDDTHELLNGKCVRPFRDLFNKYVEGENNQEEAIAFHALGLTAEGFRDDAPEGHYPHYNGYDTIFMESENQFIEGNFEYGDVRLNVQKEDVSLYVWSYSDENPIWKHLADVVTCDNDQDLYDTNDFCATESKGGMIHYDIPAEQKLAVGLHLIKLFVKGDGNSITMYIRVKPDAEQLKMVVFDMDGTLTTSDSEITMAYLNELIGKDVAEMEMYPAAPEIATYYYQRGYQIVYVTARPYWLSEKSFDWLVFHKFPMGLMHTYEGAIPDGNFDAAAFKKGYLDSLVNKGSYFSFTYGNALTDIEAYKHIGTTCDRIFIIGEHAGKECSTAVPNYPYHLTTLAQ